MQANSTYSTSICSFESAKCGKEGGKIAKIWIFREQKERSQWNKKHLFIVFKELSFGEKVNIW